MAAKYCISVCCRKELPTFSIMRSRVHSTCTSCTPQHAF